MDNKTTMPGLLTLPADLDTQARKEGGWPLYKLIFLLAVLVLGALLHLV